MGRGESAWDRFWSKVQYGDGCWEWTGYKNRDGYGSFVLDGKRPILAHRAVWILVRGEIPAGMAVLHRCDNPGCVRPSDLFLGTQLDNIRDMDRKGRRNTDPRPVGNRPVGERVHSHKLTWTQVAEIRRSFADGASKRSLSMHYGVSRPVITSIVTGQTWVLR